MNTTTTVQIPAIRDPGLAPRDSELDLFGLTHPGRVRSDNQDHFLLCTVHPQVVVHGTSLPDVDRLPLRGQRLATLLLVADGVGGAAHGEDAARIATESITRYVSSTLRCYHTAGSSNEQEFYDALKAAALEAHHAVLEETAARGGARSATTLTLGIVVWPWLYTLQIGDSRCYVYSGGVLRQATRDQTVAQSLADQGWLSEKSVKRSPFNNMLASALGSDEANPEVTRHDLSERGSVVLVCSDGLTKHVSDEEIADHLSRMTSTRQLCTDLLSLALERGGTDNVTIVAGWAPKRTDN